MSDTATPSKDYTEKERREAIIDCAGSYHPVVGGKYLPWNPWLHIRKTYTEEIDRLERELSEAREDVVMASGELMIPMPKSGSDIARLLAANSIMRRQRDEAREQRDRLAELLLEADRYVHTCPFKARIRAALEAVKGGSDE